MPESAPPPISVVICTRDRPQDVALCLPTVLANGYPHFEVVLVDQSASDDTQAVAETLSQRFPALRYHRTGTVGKSVALNLGIGLAKHGLLAFTDDDCEAPADWLQKVAENFAADEAVDILFGQVLPSPALRGMKDICVPSWTFTEARALREGEVCGMGANMAVRARALARLPEGDVYDSSLGPGARFPAAEEGDCVYRLRRAGASAALRPDLALYHRAYRSPERWRDVMVSYGCGDGAFYAKHTRCGDLRALASLVGKGVRTALRACAKAVLRRSNSEAHYFHGLCRGVWQSRRLRVDHASRLYVSPLTRP